MNIPPDMVCAGFEKLPMKKSYSFWLLVVVWASLECQANPQPKVDPVRSSKSSGIDTIRLHQTYRDGDFDILITLAESAIKSAAHATASESLFVHKHLAVVYAKNPEKGEMAKYHMIRMLNIDPQATLYDMDASDAVYALFDRVKAENDVRIRRRSGATPTSTGSRQKTRGFDGGPSDIKREWNVEPDKKVASRQDGDSKQWLYWVGGISAVGLGVGIAAYLWSDSKSNIVINPVDNSAEVKP
jgi:hypothetical protein